MENVGLMVALAGAMTKAPTAEQVSTAVDAWLDDHPEATTTVEDGAITNAKLASSFVTPGTAAAYSSSATYAVGDYVFYNGALYRCISAISTAEAWTAAHWTQVALGNDVSDLKSALSNNGNTVHRLSNLVNTYEPYTISGTATSGSTPWAATLTVKNITLRAGEKYKFEVSANEALASDIYSELHEANGTEITSLLLETGQTNAHKTFVASGDYENAYIVFKTGITTGITLTNKISIDSSIPAIEVLKNNAMQDILAIPLKNASGSAITNYRVYYFSIKTGEVFHAITKNGTGMNLLATYADGTTGILSGVDGNDRTVTVIKDVKYIGYYLSSGFDDTLYIYGNLYLEQRAELEQIKNRGEIKNGTFSINGYISSTGSISTDANAKRTDYISVEQYDHLFVDTIIGNAGCSIAFFDQNKGFISADSVLGEKRNYTMAIPQSAKFVIFSAYAFPSASAYLYVDGSVSRKQIIDEQNITDLQTWSRKTFDTDAFGAFAKFGVCGDSLSVGYMDDSHGTAHGRNIYYSWGQALARRYGNVCLNFGFSGCTTKTWYTDTTHGKVEVIVPENLCQCYLVGLGANDSVDDSNVGTASDINLSDYTQNADTFYGNYGKVLQLLLDTAQSGYVFAFTLPTLSYATALKNNAIRGAVAKIDSDRLFLVDLEQDYKHLFTSSFIADNVVGAHYSAIGYANIATAISLAVTDVMNKNNTAFTDLAFAPYGSNDVIE